MKNSEKITPKVLALFCGWKSSCKNDLNTPFYSNEGYAVATNNVSLVFFSKTMLPKEVVIEPPTILRFEELLSKLSTPSICPAEEVCLTTVNWQRFLTAKLLLRTPRVECGCCDGHGELYASVEYKHRSYNCAYECPICKGSGVEVQATDKCAKEPTFEDATFVEFKGRHFNAADFYKLRQLQVLIGEQTPIILDLLPQDRFHPLKFRVGQFSVVIQPWDMGKEVAPKLIAKI